MRQTKGSGEKWIWRYSHLGKRPKIGSGSYPLVSLADARKSTDTSATGLAQGRDPIAERHVQEVRLRHAGSGRPDRPNPDNGSDPPNLTGPV